MEIKTAGLEDLAFILSHDHHITSDELTYVLTRGRVLIAWLNGDFIGWLRWNLFWDNAPFLTMLTILKKYQGQEYGRNLVLYWESMMKQSGYNLIMTSSLSDEEGQHFFRKLHYLDAGVLNMKNCAPEILFTKEI